MVGCSQGSHRRVLAQHLGSTVLCTWQKKVLVSVTCLLGVCASGDSCADDDSSSACVWLGMLQKWQKHRGFSEA